jgi:uncharacterized protein (TIGR02145 family)
MSLQSQLTRLAHNVGALTADTNAIFEALRAKGVDVPSDAQLSDVADMIYSIGVEIGGHKYPVVKIGNQLWTAENLLYPLSSFGNQSGTSSCWANFDSSNSDGYGMLYCIGDIRTNGSMRSELDAVIPTGWRLPTLNDFYTLTGSSSSINVNKLMSNRYSGGTNEYGFNGLLSGFSAKDWDYTVNVGSQMGFFVDELGDTSIYLIEYNNSSSTGRPFNQNVAIRVSVRLVKDLT